MYPFPLLTRPVRRYLQERLEGLHDALASLARRLRESIAAVIGTHIGEAVRDAVQAALDQRTRASPPRDDPDDWHDSSGEYGEHRSPEFDAPPGLWQGPVHEPTPPVPHDTCSNGPPRWWSFLPAALQALSCWLRHKKTRRPVLAVLGIGTMAGTVALLVSPIAGALLAAGGTVFTLTGLVDGIRDTVGSLAGAPAP